MQQHFGGLWLQVSFENSTFDLGEEDTVQLAPLENGQLPVRLGEVLLLLQSQGAPQLLLLQAVQGPQEAAALARRLWRGGHVRG